MIDQAPLASLTTSSRERLRQRIERMDPGQSAPNVEKNAKASPRLRLMILAPLAILLIWEVMTRSVAAYLADAMPEIAIRLRSTNSTALLNLAQKMIRLDPILGLDPATKNLEPSKEASRQPPVSEVHSPQDPAGADAGADRVHSSSAARSSGVDPRIVAQISSLAELALINDPLNARAFAVLGHLSDSSADEAKTQAFMQTAARRSLLETTAVYWMMRRAYQDEDYRSAISYGDALIRNRLAAIDPVMPIFAQIAENPNASGELKELLGANPSWRKTFFERLPSSVSDGRTVLDILLSLKEAPNPPTTAELQPYLNLLIANGFHELAYYTWLQFLPEEQLSKVGNLFNGKFEFPPSGLPFDWSFSEGPGVTIQIAEPTDLGHALVVKFGPGRINEFRVEQLTVLGPGTYEFRGKHKVNIVSERGLLWRIKCELKSNNLIGESSSVKGNKSIQDFAFSFTVPGDCPAQSIQLILDARSASEQFITGSAWFSDLRVERKPSAEEKS